MDGLSDIETSPTTAPSPEPERRGPRRAAVTVIGIVAAVTIIAAGWFYATTQVDQAGASGTFLTAVPKLTVTSDPTDGAVDVRPDATVNVTAKYGRILSAQLLDDAEQASPGVVAPDGSAWSSAGSARGSRSPASSVVTASACRRHEGSGQVASRSRLPSRTTMRSSGRAT